MYCDGLKTLFLPLMEKINGMMYTLEKYGLRKYWRQINKPNVLVLLFIA